MGGGYQASIAWNLKFQFRLDFVECNQFNVCEFQIGDAGLLFYSEAPDIREKQSVGSAREFVFSIEHDGVEIEFAERKHNLEFTLVIQF